MIRFLFDECMSPRLVAEAFSQGYDATHINRLGLSGRADDELLPTIIAGNYTFVTNNRRDFLKLYRYVDGHHGLLIIIPCVPSGRQIELLQVAIREIWKRGDDMANQLIEVDVDGNVRFSRYPFDGEN